MVIVTVLTYDAKGNQPLNLQATKPSGGAERDPFHRSTDHRNSKAVKMLTGSHQQSKSTIIKTESLKKTKNETFKIRTNSPRLFPCLNRNLVHMLSPKCNVAIKSLPSGLRDSVEEEAKTA